MIAHLEPVEEFVSVYTVPDTTSKTLATVVHDVLQRFIHSISNMRGQSYDEAANMSGAYNGCQALLSRDQPLELFIHCSAHCSKLVAQQASLASVPCRDSMHLVNEVGALYSNVRNKYSKSCKFATSMKVICDSVDIGHRKLKPMWRTR